MFSYDSRAALADEHRARMLARAERSRMVQTALVSRPRRTWLSRLGLTTPAQHPPVPVNRRVRDRRVAKVPVLVERRTGYDRRSPLAA